MKSKNLNNVEASTTVRSVERALDILEILMNQSRPISLREISDRTKLHPSTAHRLLTTLDKRFFVSQDSSTKLYTLGPKFSIPLHGTRSFELIKNLSYPILQRTSEQSGEGASFSVRIGNQALCIAKVSSGRSIDISIQNGAILPMHSTAVGKAILSQLSTEEVEIIINTTGLTPSTSNTITDRKKLLTVLKETRDQGYATDYEEWEIGIRCIASPVKDINGHVIGAISVSGPAGRFSFSEILRLASIVQVNSQLFSQKLSLITQEIS